MDFILASLQTLPNFIAYILVAAALLALFALIYLWITPYPELRLIGQGNSAAALNFVAALFGFILPLANVIAHSVNLVDVVLWAGVALVVQLLAHLVSRLLIADFTAKIEAANMAAAILASGLAVGFGLLNAACLTY